MIGTTLCALIAGLAFASSPALAFTEYQNVAEFGSSTLNFPKSLTVDQINGDVLVADQETGHVQRFTPSNRSNPSAGYSVGSPISKTFESPSGVAVDTSGGASQGEIYVSDSKAGEVYKFLASGEPDPTTPSFGAGASPVGLSTPSGVAVDPANGNVYVADEPSNMVDIYKSSGEFIEQFEAEAPGGIALDSTGGGVYVVDNSSGTVEEFDAAGTPVIQTAGPNAGTNTVDSSGSATAVAVNPASNDVYITERFQQRVDLYDATGATLEPPTISVPYYFTFAIGVDGLTGTVFLANYECCGGPTTVYAFKATPLPNVTTGPTTNSTQSAGTLTGHVDPDNNGKVTGCKFEYGTDTSYSLGSIPCSPATPYSSPTDVTGNLSGLTTEVTYHYRLVVENANGTAFGSDETFTPHAVAEVSTEPASSVMATTATLNGSFVGNGEDTKYFFEWGTEPSYGNKSAVPPGLNAGSPTGPETTALSSDLSDLEPLTTYHYRLVASNSVGTSFGGDQTFTTMASAPLLEGESVSNVHSDSAVLHAVINPANAETVYHFEYGLADCSANPCASSPVIDADIGPGANDINVNTQLSGLTANTMYHYRVVAENTTGTTDGLDHTFVTFPAGGVLTDTCPNAHVRQQTGAALLLDCRAYELVSAADTGGYDVESSLVAGQTPFGGYPEASGATGASRVLYGVHDGGIPGTGHPTNRGVDPYVATRGETGWSSEYVGIPANIDSASDPFSSTLAEATPNLETFAFSGEALCAPCFGEGIETGIPLHLPNGSLVQGMAGSINPGPKAFTGGHIAKYFSADGSHFIFGSTSQFEPDANNNGDVSIYDRDLSTGETHVVSKTPQGENLPCLQGAGNCHSPGDPNGIAELDLSKDGSRVIVAQKVSTDEDGNVYWHPYMDIDDEPKTVDLAPGTSSGVLYDGMSEDGSKVFFTTKDKLLAQDTDESADLYEAEVSSEGKLNLVLISATATAGNSESCDPVSNEAGAHWNSLEATPNCGVVAIGGGGGVATEDGTVYFLSPEDLTPTCACLSGDPTADQPNLYVVRSGEAPQFVATLAPNDPAVVDAVKEAGTHHYGDFQVTPSGEYAAFTSILPLTDYENAGYSEVYRFDAASGKLDCASCDPTNASATGDATLPYNGLGLANDGRVFFNSTDALAPRDLDEKEDAYEWEQQGFATKFGTNCQTAGGCLGLISTGISPFNSSLLGVSSDGTDAYFFTRDTLVPQDENGKLVKIYDARAGGGFPYEPPPPPCKASDECHGPGSVAPEPPTINTVTGTRGDVPATQSARRCKTGFVKEKGKCIRRAHKPKRHHHRKVHRHG